MAFYGRRRYTRRNYKSRTKRNYRVKKIIKRKYKRSMRRLPLTGFPMKKIVKLRYCDEIQLNAASGAATSHVFSANGMYDPDISGTGHQPKGFDQWMAVYDHYTVIGSSITVTYAPSTSASSVPGYVGIILSDSTNVVSTFANISDLLESKFNTRSKGVMGMSYHLVNNRSAVIRKGYSTRKFFGKAAAVNSSLFRGNNANNPPEQCYFEVYQASVGSNDPAVINLLITIDYIAVLTEPKELPQS